VSSQLSLEKRRNTEGDRVVARVQFTGTDDGPYDGRPPTHNKLSFSTADFFRIAVGKIAQHWDVVNVLPRMIALWPDPAAGVRAEAAGGCDGKAALAIAQQKRPGHFRPGRHELNSSNLRDQTQRRGIDLLWTG
jgi:hypothetical protein